MTRPADEGDVAGMVAEVLASVVHPLDERIDELLADGEHQGTLRALEEVHPGGGPGELILVFDSGRRFVVSIFPA